MKPLRNMTRLVRAIFAAVVALAIAAALIVFLAGVPRSDRDRAADQAWSRASRSRARRRIDSLRDFRHRPGGEFDAAYRSESFDTADVRAVWFALAPFAKGTIF